MRQGTGLSSTLQHRVVSLEELKRLLPRRTFDRFALFADVLNRHGSTWADLLSAFTKFAQQRVAFGALAKSTYERYQQTFAQKFPSRGKEDAPTLEILLRK